MTKIKKPKRRHYKNWLDAYLLYCAAHEAPPIVHLWTGISVIAAALERKVWIDRGYWSTKPNMYTMIVAESSVVHKTTATDIGIGMLAQIEPKVNIVAERLTTAGLIYAMSKLEAEYMTKEGEVRSQSAGLVYAPELSILLGEIPGGGGDICSLLTRMFDCKDGAFEYGKAKEEPTIHYPCINILADTTPDDLRTLLPRGALGSGFSARFTLCHIIEAGEPKSHPKDYMLPDSFKYREKLVEDLETIHRISGEFVETKEAAAYYKKWYDEDYELTKIGKPVIDEEAFRSYISRRREQIFKLAMVGAVAEGDKLILEIKHMKQAIKWQIEIEITMPSILAPFGRNVDALDTQKIYNHIRNAGRIKHSNLLRKHQKNLTAGQFAMCIRSLRQAELIDSEMEGRANYYFAIDRDVRDIH